MNLPRILIAAPRSGGGKTTFVCGLLRLLQKKDLSPAPFKCGPDFIDPLFHRELLGLSGANLDLFFTGEETVRGLLARYGKGHDLAVLEGVMGYYDGVGGTTETAGSYDLARATDTPVLLVLDARGVSLSLAAEVKGFLSFRTPSRIAGLFLNRCSASLHTLLAPVLERETGLPVLGYLPPDDAVSLESRHLGLVTPEDVQGLPEKLDRLAETLERSLDLERLLAVAKSAPPLENRLATHAPVHSGLPLRLAVARDRAFCFYYRENLDLLRELGAEPVFFSPLTDRALPENCDGLYLGGGYPELWLGRLAENRPMLESVRHAVCSGLPTLAECGGFLYLHREIRNRNGTAFPGAAVLDSCAAPAGGLRRFGYITLTAEHDTLLCSQGDSIRAHEFHYWDSEHPGDAFTAAKPLRSTRWPCIHAQNNLFAGFPHLYFYSNPSFAARFVRAMAERRKRKDENK